MLYRTDNNKTQSVKFEAVADYLEVDLPELLARKVVDTTINEVILRVNEDNSKDKNANVLWSQFVKELREYNDIEKIHKTDTKYKSQYGKSIVGFDMYQKHPIIWFADGGTGESLRINGQKQYMVNCTRTYSTLQNGIPILKNELVITDKNTAYLFKGGFGVSIKNQNKINEINKNEELAKSIKEGWVPFKWCNIRIPQYIQEQFRIGTFNHDYGVLPAMEMLNKDFVDSDSGVYIQKGEVVDIVFADWFPARDIIVLFNGFLQFFAGEMCLDHTRVIGMFSQQDINALTGNNKNNKQTPEQILKQAISRIQPELSPEQELVMKKLILRSVGGEGTKVEKMQTTLRALEFTQTLDQLIVLFFKMSGYSWDTDAGKVYENVSQTMNSSKGVYESTKEKIVLFERQWKEFYSKIAFVWFKQQGKPFTNLDEARQEFEKNIEFRIVSNVLQQENNDYQKVVELSQSNLISKYKAIKDLNPDMSNEEIQEEIDRIEEESEKDSWDNFDNRDYLGFEENENPARDNMGRKNVKGDN